MGRGCVPFKGSAMNSQPSVTDLGVMYDDVLLFGGAYSNLQAMLAMVDVAEQRGIPRWRRICTGDVVAYCADPAVTETAVVVAGNCERQIAEGAEACGCGFAEGSACDIASGTWFPYAAQQLQAHHAACAACPDIAMFTHSGRRYAVIHGGQSDIAKFLWAVTPEKKFQLEIKLLEGVLGPIDGVVCGHSGIPFQRWIGDVLWVNAGVIGMPPHDGRPETRFAVLSDDGVRIERLSYDHERAAKAMEQAGLTQGYDTALRSGIWPSEDVLPPELRC